MATDDHKPGVPPGKPSICQVRRLTVQQIYQPQRGHALKSDTAVPWIRMQGQWLHRAGFEVNAPLTVRVMPGCLVLTVEEQG